MLISAGVGGQQVSHGPLSSGIISAGWCSFRCRPIDRETCGSAEGCLDLQWGCWSSVLLSDLKWNGESQKKGFCCCVSSHE